MREITKASEDPRVRRTRSALQEALIELAGQRDPELISVSEIVAHAGVSRSTFYDHYPTLEHLAEDACTTLFDELAAGMPSLDVSAVRLSRPPADTLPVFFDHFAIHAGLYGRLLGAGGSARLLTILRQRMTTASYVSRRRPEGVSEGDTHATDPAVSPFDPVAAFLGGGSLAIAIDWVERGCPGTAQELADLTWRMLVSATAELPTSDIPSGAS